MERVAATSCVPARRTTFTDIGLAHYVMLAYQAFTVQLAQVNAAVGPAFHATAMACALKVFMVMDYAAAFH